MRTFFGKGSAPIESTLERIPAERNIKVGRFHLKDIGPFFLCIAIGMVFSVIILINSPEGGAQSADITARQGTVVGPNNVAGSANTSIGSSSQALVPQPPPQLHRLTAGGIPLRSFFELALPTAVLLMEGWGLLLMGRESRERDKDSEDRQRMEKRLRELSISHDRREYLEAIADGIRSSRAEVIFATYSMETTKFSLSQKNILQAVAEVGKGIGEQQRSGSVGFQDLFGSSKSIAQCYSRDYRHVGIVAARLETIAGAVELTLKTKDGPNPIHLRMCKSLRFSRLRFTVIDHETCIIGYGDRDADGSQLRYTSHSATIKSRLLADCFRLKFEELYKKGSTIWGFIDESILEADPRPDLETVLSWCSGIDFPIGDVRQALLQHCQTLTPTAAPSPGDGETPVAE
jgi:hypothetical protein